MIAGIVLAAGTSSRFGRTKQVEVIAGKPLAQHAVDALTGAGLGEVIVVLGHDAETLRSSVALPANGRFVENPAFSTGMASSLTAGLDAASERAEAAVILLADQPGITPEHVRALVEAFEARRSRIVRLAFLDGPGPSLLSRAIWPEARALEGDVGARALAERHPEWVEHVEISENAPPDIDTVRDLDARRGTEANEPRSD